jgi:hypothetical protein
MNIIDWSKFNVRCSAIGKIMTNAQGYAPLTEKQEQAVIEFEKKDKEKGLTDKQREELNALYAKREMSKKTVLSDTHVTYLMEEYAWRVYRKKSVSKELDIEYTAKGREVEEESINLLSRYDKKLYKKNTQRIENDFLSGEPDVFTGEIITQAEAVTDIKSIWDYPGFLKKLHSDLESDYIWQIKGYGDLCNTKDLSVANCLVNMSEGMIFDYLQRLLRRMNVISADSPEYLAKAEDLEHSMRFDDIPFRLRVKKVPIDPFSDIERQNVYDKVKKSRDWLCEFDEIYQSVK